MVPLLISLLKESLADLVFALSEEQQLPHTASLLSVFCISLHLCKVLLQQ